MFPRETGFPARPHACSLDLRRITSLFQWAQEQERNSSGRKGRKVTGTSGKHLPINDDESKGILVTDIKSTNAPSVLFPDQSPFMPGLPAEQQGERRPAYANSRSFLRTTKQTCAGKSMIKKTSGGGQLLIKCMTSSKISFDALGFFRYLFLWLVIPALGKKPALYTKALIS